jgi:hypothetical protein
MTTQEEFFQQHAVDGVLPEHLMTDMLMLSGGGDTPGSVSLVDTEHADSVTGATGKDNAETGAEAKTVEKPGDGKTDPVVVPPKDEDLNADNAVILAKDGKHTIGFEKLEQERTARRAAEAEAQRLREENERLTKATAGSDTQPGGEGGDKPAGGKATAATPEQLLEGVDFGDYSDPAVARALSQMVAKATEPLTRELEALRGTAGEAQKLAELTETQKHYEAIYKAHADADSIVESQEFSAWQKALPKFQQVAVAQALAQGETSDIIDVFSTYKAATGKTGAAANDTVTGAEGAAAAAEKAIAQAKVKPPSSLTDLPAGTAAAHDEATALLEMSAERALASFEGKDPAAIMAALNRAL